MLMGCESEFFSRTPKKCHPKRWWIVLFKMLNWSWVKYQFLHLRPSSHGDDWKSTLKKTFWSWWRPVAYGSYLRWISQIWPYNWKPSNHMTFSRLSVHIFCGRAFQPTRMSNFCRRPSWPRNPRYPRWYLQGGKSRGKKPIEPQCSCELQEFWSRCFFLRINFQRDPRIPFVFCIFFSSCHSWVMVPRHPSCQGWVSC